MRETRLRTWHPDKLFRAAQLAQAQANLPLLFLASIDLARHAATEGAERLLMSSRDCWLWAALLRRLGPRVGFTGEVVYFHTSRVARVGASADYLAYFRELAAIPSVAVDLCGTGWSLSRLLQAAGNTRTSVFLLRRIVDDRLRAERERVAAVAREARTAWALEAEGSSVPIELVNATDHGSIRDVAMIAGRPFPLFDALPDTPGASDLVAAQTAAFEIGLAAQAVADVAADRLHDDAARHAMLRVLHESLPGHAEPLTPLQHRTDAEDARMEAMLRGASPGRGPATGARLLRLARARWSLATSQHRRAT